MLMDEQKVSVKLSLLEFQSKRTYGLCIRHKEDVLGWRILAAIVRFLTVGKVNLLEKFWTTIGNVVYVPKRVDQNGKNLRFGDLPFADYPALRHELFHVAQFYKWGFPSFRGGRAIGVVLLGFCYFFVFFPVGLAYVRYRLEREAYLEGLLAARSIGLNILQRKEKAIQYCSVSPYYLWMWPFPRSVRRWFETQLDIRSHSALRPSQDA